MLCPSCGKEVSEANGRCGACGSVLPSKQAAAVDSVCGVGASASDGNPNKAARRSRRAAASLVLGLSPFVFVAGVWLFAIFFEPGSDLLTLGYLIIAPAMGVLSVIFGHRAKKSIRRSEGLLAGKGMATVGLTLGYLSLGLWLLLLPPVFPFVPGYVPSRIAANQASTVGSLRTINTAAITYSSTHNHGFPSSLLMLAPPNVQGTNADQQPSEKATGLIDERLASSSKSGYRFTYIPGPVDSAGKIQSYTLRAGPIDPGVTGNKYYFTDQFGVIRQEERKEADEHSPPIN